MNVIGFMPEDNGAVIAVRDPNGRIWDSVPADVRVVLQLMTMFYLVI